MELFIVVDNAGKKVESFTNKMDAKALRNELGMDKGYRVRRGKDNLPSPRGYPSMMRRQPK